MPSGGDTSAPTSHGALLPQPGRCTAQRNATHCDCQCRGGGGAQQPSRRPRAEVTVRRSNSVPHRSDGSHRTIPIFGPASANRDAAARRCLPALFGAGGRCSRRFSRRCAGGCGSESLRGRGRGAGWGAAPMSSPSHGPEASGAARGPGLPSCSRLCPDSATDAAAGVAQAEQKLCNGSPCDAESQQKLRSEVKESREDVEKQLEDLAHHIAQTSPETGVQGAEDERAQAPSRCDPRAVRPARASAGSLTRCAPDGAARLLRRSLPARRTWRTR